MPRRYYSAKRPAKKAAAKGKKLAKPGMLLGGMTPIERPLTGFGVIARDRGAPTVDLGDGIEIQGYVVPPDLGMKMHMTRGASVVISTPDVRPPKKQAFRKRLPLMKPPKPTGEQVVKDLDAAIEKSERALSEGAELIQDLQAAIARSAG